MPEQTEFDYDVFISYSSRDKTWVKNKLLKRIEKAGLQAFIDFRDFKRGAPSIKEMERGVMRSRKTLLVLTPDYINSEWCEIETIMLQTISPANKDLRLIPLLKSPCEKPLRIGALTHIDFTDGANLKLAWKQLLLALEDECQYSKEQKISNNDSIIKAENHSQIKQGNKNSKSKTVVFDLPPLTNFFTGRESTLKSLYNTLDTYNNASFHGMFGIGKTTVSLKYAYEYQKEYTSTIFIRASETEFFQQITNIAESFDKKKVSELKRIEDKAIFFRHYLDDPSNWSKKDKKYLLIFDNVDKIEQVKSFVPSNKQGHIIFTSNDRNITALGNEVEISEIQTNEGKLLLYRRSIARPKIKKTPQKDHHFLEKIVLELGNSPLAINIAGAYIYSAKVSFKDYLGLINEKSFLEEEDKTDFYQNKTILRAFKISYSATCRADKNNKDSKLIAESAKHIIQSLISFSTNNIKEEMLKKLLLNKGKKFERIVNDNYLWSKVREKTIRFDLLRYESKRQRYWTHKLIQLNIEKLLNIQINE